MASSTKPGLISRSVASCFLFKLPPNSAKPQVALFRRSAKVRTYQHRLAPISGSIEESDKSPLAAVWREINEETTLTSANLNLFRKGKPYSFTDEGVGRVWTVHPFAFSLKTAQDEGEIRLDWEHDRYQWHDPLEVSDDEGAGFGGVPFLAKSLRRVWLDMDLGEERGRLLSEGLKMLQEDHESGARVLAGKALGVFESVLVTGTEGQEVGVWWENARFAAWHLWKNGRESMGAAVLNVLLRALGEIEQEVKPLHGGVVTGEMLEQTTRHLNALSEERKRSVGQVWSSFKPVIERARGTSSNSVKILTLSSSSTIHECLKNAATAITDGAKLDIRILESRPLFEGAKMASQLAKSLPENSSSVDITVFSDAAAALASKNVDMVLLGADLIAKDGAVSNKTGSLPAILSAKHVSPNAKVVVLAEKEKILPFDVPEDHEENKAEEITEAWNRGPALRHSARHDTRAPGDRVQVKNIYFEWVPPSLVDIFVTEDGEMDVLGITGLADKRKLEADMLFAET